MLQELSHASLEIGLKMNMSKTKVMIHSNKFKIRVHGEVVHYVQEYNYLGQIVSFQSRKMNSKWLEELLVHEGADKLETP